MLKIIGIILFPNSFFPLLLFSYYSAIILILFSNLINICDRARIKRAYAAYLQKRVFYSARCTNLR